MKRSSTTKRVELVRSHSDALIQWERGGTILLFLITLAAVACTEASRIDGRWELIELKTADREALQIDVMESIPFIEFDSGTAAGDTGCDEFETGYDMARETLTFHGGFITLVGCGLPGELPIDRLFQQALRDEVEVSVRGNTMGWHTEDGLEFTFSSAP